MQEIAEVKRQMREKIRRRASELPISYFKEVGRKISEHACNMPEYSQADTVLGFVSTAREADTRNFLQNALATGKRLAVPLCAGSGVMEAREIRSFQDLRPGKYGIWEPALFCPVIPASEIQFALLPCVSCTPSGKRLGHGGGYYDRYLAGYSGIAVLACPEALLCKELPTERFDVSIPFVITENVVYKYGLSKPLSE